MLKTISLVISLGLTAVAAANNTSVQSPSGEIQGVLSVNGGKLQYTVSHGSAQVLANSTMGVVRLDGDFSQNFTLAKCENQPQRKEVYTMLHGKQEHISSVYSQTFCTVLNARSEAMVVEMLASDTSFAFRYTFPENGNVSTKYITSEKTTFRIASSPTDYQILQPYDSPTPKYQTFYQPRTNRSRARIGSASSPTGFGLPGLFKTDINNQSYYVQIKETGFNGRYPAVHFSNASQANNFALGFPDPNDGNGMMGDVRPHSPLPWSTPYRIITIGRTLAPAVEDTSMTDLAQPQQVKDTGFIKPGVTSWSWWSDGTNSGNYTANQAFIDMSGKLGWPYSLLDASWDQQTDSTGKVFSLSTAVSYAKSRGVQLWLWINSAGVNNNASVITSSPKDLMWQPDIRHSTMDTFAKLGIAGFKFDGVQSDKQEMMAYILSVLYDAAAYGLQVVVHNCPTPKGWERTWPNLLSTEGLIASEYYTNAKTDYGSQVPENNVHQAFVRYPVGSADYSPGTFSRDIHNKSDSLPTTDAHETALNVIIDSGLRVLPDTPDAYLKTVDPAIVSLITSMPFVWDQARFIAGEPGAYFVTARQRGQSLYVAAINGETTFISPITNKSDPSWKPAVGVSRNLTVKLDPATYGFGQSAESAKVTIIEDTRGSKKATVSKRTGFNGSLALNMEPFGGYVALIEW